MCVLDFFFWDKSSKNFIQRRRIHQHIEYVQKLSHVRISGVIPPWMVLNWSNWRGEIQGWVPIMPNMYTVYYIILIITYQKQPNAIVLVLQMPAHTNVDKTEQDEIHNSQIWWRSYWSKSTKYILSFTIVQYFNPFKQNSSWEPLFYFNLKKSPIMSNWQQQ